MQKSALNNFIYLLNSIVILGFVSNFQFSTVENKLIILSIVYSLSINIPLLLSSIAVFSTSLKNCRPNLKFVKKEYAKSIIKLGGMFFWIQIMYMVLTGTNEFLITWFVSPNAVVEYQIYNRVFSMSGTLFTLAITPF
jgi:hypothetical protein